MTTHSLLHHQAFINGRWVSAHSKATFPVLNAATSQVIAEIRVWIYRAHHTR